MKLIMKNWTKLQEANKPGPPLNEVGGLDAQVLAALHADIMAYLEQQGQVPMEEGWRDWGQKMAGGMKKGMATAAMMGALAGGGMPDAHAGDQASTDSNQITQQAQAEQGADYYNTLLGLIDGYIGSSPDKMDMNLKFMNIQKALDSAADDGDTSGLDGLNSHDSGLLKIIEKHLEKNMSDTELVDHWKAKGEAININEANKKA